MGLAATALPTREVRRHPDQARPRALDAGDGVRAKP
jgi:hypothetical protein